MNRKTKKDIYKLQEMEFDEIKEKLNILNKKIVAVGCKCDLADKREIPAEEGANMSKSRDVDAFIECSSKTGENVEELLKTLTRLILQRDNLI